MHWLEGMARVKVCRIGWPDSFFGIVGSDEELSPRWPKWRVRTGMLRRAIVGINHVACPCSRWRDSRLAVIGAGQRKQRIEQARFLQAEKDRVGAQQGAEAALAEFDVGACRILLRGSGCRFRPFFRPPRSNTRKTLPGCEISQRSSGSARGDAFHARFFGRGRRHRVRSLAAGLRQNSFRRNARSSAGKRRCYRAPLPTACRRGSSCWSSRADFRGVASRCAAGFRRNSQIAGVDEADVRVILVQPLGVQALGIGGNVF